MTLCAIVLVVALMIAISIPGLRHVQGEVEAKACVDNLIQLSIAKEHYILDHDLKPGAPVTLPELEQTGRLKGLGKCPLGGMYAINSAGAPPTCSVGHSHKLPKQSLSRK